MRLVAYIRVSTERQGQSGLGLAAQREIIERFAQERGHQIVAEYVEVQSGKDDSRPELARALAQARLARAGIIVAKLDRLARSAHFLETFVRSGVDVLFCNLPDLPPGPTGRFMVQVMASIAELEAGMISERTKGALQAARERGKTLGGFRGTAASPKAREASAKARASKADSKALEVMASIEQLKSQGKQSLRDLAEGLTAAGVRPPMEHGHWTPMGVKRVIDRVKSIHQRELEAAQQRMKELEQL